MTKRDDVLPAQQYTFVTFCRSVSQARMPSLPEDMVHHFCASVFTCGATQ